MSYVVVGDMAASWECYRPFATAFSGAAPEGLILHAAGRTDEGFRIVGVWTSEEAWLRFAERLGMANGSHAPPHAFRALQIEHVVYGEREEQ